MTGVGFSSSQIDLLSAKLSVSHVKSRKQGGRQVSYVEGWHAIAEANRIFGFDAWTRETVDCRCVAERERQIGADRKAGWGVSYVAKVRVIVQGVAREGYGAGHGIDVDLGQAHESAIKEAETDAMKRALMTFGNPFGLALYDKEQADVERDPPREPIKAAPPAAEAARVEVEPGRADDLATDIMDDMSTAKTIAALDQIALHRKPESDALPDKQYNRVFTHYEALKAKLPPAVKRAA